MNSASSTCHGEVIHILIIMHVLNIRILAGAGYGLLATTVYTVEVVSKEARGSILVFAGVTRYEAMTRLPYFCLRNLGVWVPSQSISLAQ